MNGFVTENFGYLQQSPSKTIERASFEESESLKIRET